LTATLTGHEAAATVAASRAMSASAAGIPARREVLHDLGGRRSLLEHARGVGAQARRIGGLGLALQSEELLHVRLRPLPAPRRA